MLACSPQREQILAKLTDAEKAALTWAWDGFWARPKQVPPPWAWQVWLILAGRGFGKTRTGNELVRAWVGSHTKRSQLRIALVARTSADVRDVIVEGESGLLNISPPWNRPDWQPSKRRLTWPNGATATTYSADKPDQLRGPQHHKAYCDELASWKYPEAFDQLMFGLRLGLAPQCIVTTTPRPTPIIRQLVGAKTTALTTGTTYENKDHLAGAFLDKIVAKYENTRLGRQELYAEILDDTPGALWTRTTLDKQRVRRAPELVRIVVAIDPAVTATEDSCETGIVVAGIGRDGNGYVLEDLSDTLSPDAWARCAVGAYYTHEADCVIAEVNNGGDLVGTIVHSVDKKVNYQAVHAARGKRTRAEPVAALYEQGRVFHVGGFAQLEDQMCSWSATDGERSPDRIDALVWALSELMIEGGLPVRKKTDVHVHSFEDAGIY